VTVLVTLGAAGGPGPGPRPAPSPGSELARLGGFDVLEAILGDFVGRVMRDPMIGFMFASVDPSRLQAMEAAFAASHLDPEIPWTGRPLRTIHAPHPIGRGHFDRRRELLRQTLADHAVEPGVAASWLAHVERLRDAILGPPAVNDACPEVSGPAARPEATSADPSPISPASIAAAWDKLARSFKRIEARAPEAVRARVSDLGAAVAAIADLPSSVAERLSVARRVEDLQLELRGQIPFDPQFYREGRLAVVRVMETVRIQGAIDHARIERFFERYMRRAEAAWARMLYFFKRAGVDLAEEEKKPLPPWEQPYAQLEEYRELIWGRTQPQTKPPAPGRG
jgi:truncated hemoglobin YjbI